jgi:cyclophilin family peptidyl-prolyl cis-trans isomerase/protocatechuate 3,4-dioxygenase beta subunit
MHWASRLFQSSLFGKTQSISSRRTKTRLRIDTLESRDVPSVTGVVFNDADDNAVQDAGEVGIAGVTVELLAETGDTALYTTTTGSDGTYSFAQATSGNFRVRIPAANFTGSGALHHYSYGDNNTDPVISEPITFDDSVTFAMTQTSDPNHGGEEETGTVSGIIFHDADDDGTQETGEEGLSGVTVELLGATGDTAIATTMTGSDGSYSFDELEEGNYRIRIPASNFTGSGALHHYSYQDNEAAAVTSAAIALNGTSNFGLHQDSDPDHGHEEDDGLLSIGDTVFKDLNNDGMINDGETGIAGVKVELLGETGDTALKTATTDANGKYLFTGLAAGNYRVRIASDNFTGSGVLLNYTSSKGTDQAPDPNNDNDNDDNGTPASDGSVITGTITLTVGGEPDGDQDSNSNLSIDFGFVPPPANTALLTLGDKIFRDLNNNGQLDTGEVGIAGVIVQLLDSTGAVIKTATTNSSGNYSFTELTPGTYKVRLAESNFKDSGVLVGFKSSTGTSNAYEGDNTPDPNNNTDNEDNGTTIGTLGQTGGYIESKSITLALNGEPQGNTNNTLDFGVVPSGTIKLSLGDTVWNDINNNGILDSGEQGIAGVVVHLLDSTGKVIQTKTTDSSGKYLFTELAAGDYRVRLAAINFQPGKVLAGYTASSATVTDPDNNTDNDNNGTVSGNLGTTGTIESGAITLSIGAEPDIDVNKTLDFGLFRGYSLGNQVWNDLNNNGIKDAGENGIEGVLVRLIRAGDNAEIATATTNAQGLYLFTNVPQGDYIVELATSNFKAGGALYSFKSSTGGSSNSHEGGSTPDPDTVTTDGDDNGTTTGTLGSDGVIRSLPVTLGPDATEPTGETPDNDSETPDNRSNLTVDFGVFQETPALASLEGRVFLDYNNNGKFDGADKGIQGVTITLTGGDLTQALTVTTDADGKYKFTNLKAGTYTITETQPTSPTNQTGKDVAGSLGGDASTANTIKNIALGANKQGTGYNFGEIPVLSLAGSVFDDANGNGKKDSGETGIAGVTVTLTGTNLSGTAITPVTVTTDSSGNYKFENLTPGKYNIKETQPTGYLDGKEQNGTPAASTVGNDEFKGIDLTSTNASATGFNFGEVKAGSVKGVVYIDADNDGLRDESEVGIAGVKIKLIGTNDLGKKISLNTTTGDDGTYTFGDLRPGKYTIIETQPAKYKDGKDTTGTAIGVTTTNDQIQNITLGSGVNATGYNFGEQAAADLVVKQVISSSYTNAGGQIVVNYTITNKGSTKAAAAAVTLNLGGMKFVSSNGGTAYDKLTKTWNVGDLEAGQKKTLRVVLRSTGEAVYKISAKAASTTADLKAANNEVSDLIFSGFRASLRTYLGSTYAGGPAVTPAPIVTGPAPTTPTLTLADASDTGTKGDDRTETETVDLVGTTSANTRVTLVEKNLSVTSDAQGKYTFEDVVLAQGVNSFTVKATSANGKSSQATKSIVRNSTPTASSQIGAKSVSTGGTTMIDLAGFFTDADISNTKIKFSTSAGDINVELFDKEAPRTVANFLNYISDGDFDDSIFHRSVAGFVLQGGGYTFSTDGTAHLEEVPEDAAVQNEPDITNRSNLKGTLAMAKLGTDPNSATSQFFFNLGNNSTNLDNQNGGFTVFGKLVGTADQAVVDALAAITTKDMTNAADLPADQKTVFEDIPLKNYTGTDFPTDTTAANYAMINGVSIVSQTEKLSYSIVSNSDATAVTAAIVDNRLTLTGGSSAGSSTITIRATDLSGATVDMTFTVTVTAATT